MKKEKHVNVFGVGLFLGSLFGYVVAYFNAKKPGEELQEELKMKGSIVKEQVDLGIQSLKEDIKTAQEPQPQVEVVEVQEEMIVLSPAPMKNDAMEESTDI